MSYSPDLFLSLCLAALVAGVVNAVAGGGTLLTFPALLAAFAWMEAGDAAVIANATSTLALLPGSAASAWGYRLHLRQSGRWLLMLIGPAVLGGIIGTLLIIQYPKTFAVLVPWLLLTAAILFLIDTLMPKKIKYPAVERRTGSAELPETQLAASGSAMTGMACMQLLVSIYGGYFGAGMGIMLLSAFAWMGLANIHQMNGLKSVLCVVTNGISALIFILDDVVVWPLALCMALTAIIGGLLGSRLAQRIQVRYVRWSVVFIGFSLAGYYFVRN